jgi:hypothetical protein
MHFSGAGCTSAVLAAIWLCWLLISLQMCWLHLSCAGNLSDALPLF